MIIIFFFEMNQRTKTTLYIFKNFEIFTFVACYSSNLLLKERTHKELASSFNDVLDATSYIYTKKRNPLEFMYSNIQIYTKNCFAYKEIHEIGTI